MKFRSSWILAALAAALIVLSAAGCSGNKKGEASADESSQTSTAASQPVSKEESSDVSGQTSKSFADDLTGYWSSENENAYVNVRLMENGDAVIGSNLLEHSVLGKWSLSGKKLTLSFSGEKTEYEYKEGGFAEKSARRRSSRKAALSHLTARKRLKEEPFRLRHGRRVNRAVMCPSPRKRT